jgi:short-subunit dehydrogenase
VLIVGATSAIAEMTARKLASKETKFLLAARNSERLAAVAADLRLRCGCSVDTVSYDAAKRADATMVVEAAKRVFGRIDLVLLAHGTLPGQADCENSAERTLHEIEVNALSAIALITQIAPVLETQGRATLAVISSVAGDRGRRSNYVYGAAKGMLSIFLSGLRNRLDRKGVHVLTIKPGFVDTPMTAAFEKAGPLWATPEQIAAGIVRAIESRKDVVYLPRFWAVIMFVIRHIPERIFKVMSL